MQSEFGHDNGSSMIPCTSSAHPCSTKDCFWNITNLLHPQSLHLSIYPVHVCDLSFMQQIL